MAESRSGPTTAASAARWFCADLTISTAAAEDRQHYLDFCSRCGTPIHAGDDIYMYKGNIPFYREECREEQIEIDEEEEKRSKRTMKNKVKTAMRSTARSRELHVGSANRGTTVVAV